LEVGPALAAIAPAKASGARAADTGPSGEKPPKSTLGVLRGGWGWTLFGLVWGFAAIGVLSKSFNRRRHPA
jgi:hypothetical protein